MTIEVLAFTRIIGVVVEFPVLRGFQIEDQAVALVTDGEDPALRFAVKIPLTNRVITKRAFSVMEQGHQAVAVGWCPAIEARQIRESWCQIDRFDDGLADLADWNSGAGDEKWNAMDGLVDPKIFQNESVLTGEITVIRDINNDRLLPFARAIKVGKNATDLGVNHRDEGEMPGHLQLERGRVLTAERIAGARFTIDMLALKSRFAGKPPLKVITGTRRQGECCRIIRRRLLRRGAKGSCGRWKLTLRKNGRLASRPSRNASASLPVQVSKQWASGISLMNERRP